MLTHVKDIRSVLKKWESGLSYSSDSRSGTSASTFKCSFTGSLNMAKKAGIFDH